MAVGQSFCPLRGEKADFSYILGVVLCILSLSLGSGWQGVCREICHYNHCVTVNFFLFPPWNIRVSKEKGGKRQFNFCRTKLQKIICLVENWKHLGVRCKITGLHGEMLVELPPKLFLCGEIYFWKWRRAACSRWKFTFFMASFLSFHFILPPPANFYYTHTHKSKHVPQPKKTNPVFMLLLSLSPSGLLSLLWPSVVLLFSLHGIASQVATSEQYVVPFQLWAGGLREKKQWHLSAKGKELVGRNIAENKVKQ